MSNRCLGPWAALGVSEVINAAGKMTYLGSSSLHPDVTAAMAAAGGRYVDIGKLKVAVGERIAELTGAPAACVVSCAAAGIALSVAAAVTRTDPYLVEMLPDAMAASPEVILQKSHAVHFGAPLTQMLRLGGAQVREVGTVNVTKAHHLHGALSKQTAAIVFVVSHHSPEGIVVDLPTVVQIARTAGVPVIVDAAAETDLAKYLQVGADIAVYSGHKAVAGPTSGMVLGRPELVDACAAQDSGIGRTMKVGKETLAGLLVAVERYVSGLTTRPQTELMNVLAVVERGIAELPMTTSVVQDATRPIPRLQLTLSSGMALDARQLVWRLENNNPSVRTRNHRVDVGVIEIDPRELSLADAAALCEALHSVYRQETVGI